MNCIAVRRQAGHKKCRVSAKRSQPAAWAKGPGDILPLIQVALSALTDSSSLNSCGLWQGCSPAEVKSLRSHPVRQNRGTFASGCKRLQSFNQVLLLFSLCMYKITLTDIERAKAVLVIKTLGRLLTYLLFTVIMHSAHFTFDILTVLRQDTQNIRLSLLFSGICTFRQLDWATCR